MTPSFSSIENILFSEVTIYPNPADNMVNLVFDSPFSGVLNVIDLTGKVVYTKQIEGKLNECFSVEHFSRGVFMVSMINPSGECINQKLVVL